MNLDNYFARFLHKGGASKSTTATATATPKSTETTTPLLFPVTPAPLAGKALTTGEHPPTGGNSSSSNIGRSTDDAGSAPQQQLQHFNGQLHTSPTGAGEGSSASSSSPLLPQHSESTAAAALKRPREELDLVPQAPAKRAAVTVRGASDEDDDELALLLGSQEARQVRQADAKQAEMARVQRESIVTPTTAATSLFADAAAAASSAAAGGLRNTREAASACAISSLTWATSTSHLIGAFSLYFRRQFEYDLCRSRRLYTAFEPFFRDRALRRIQQDASLCPVFHPAPRITQENVAALPGCVLRAYQVEGVQFLLDHFHGGMSCILGDDMGLGKTAQISAFLHTLKQLHGIEGPHLIVAPLSTLTSWTRELARWAPQLRVVKYHGKGQARMQARHARHNRRAVFVTTPALINQDKGFFRKRAWVTLVVDEAHVLKTQNTAVTTVSRKLTACYRVAVTGTPVHNNVQEVWSLMGVLYPWLIAAYDPSVRDPVRQAEECAAVLQCVMLRRTKAGMELGIPPRVDEPLTRLAPTYVQRHLLAQLTRHALQEDGTGHRMQAHLTHQRAVCNHPLTVRLLADEGRGAAWQDSVEARMQAAGIPMDAAHIIDPSAKMQYLDTLLPRLRSDGHRCLIFSNFTATLDLLEAMCRLRGYSYERLDGSCNRVERELAMLRFNHPRSSCFVFLVTTTAGGVGVTLTGADTVILYDAHFNPQLDRQAADRAHRIGQTRTVHVYRLCLQGTVEEHIRDIAARKASLGDFIVEGGQNDGGSSSGSGARSGATKGNGGDAGRVTADDIREMFRRLEEQRKDQQTVPAHSSSNNSSNNAVSSPASDLDSDASHAAENAMIRDLLHVEENGLPGSAVAALMRRAGASSRVGTLGNPVKHTNVCFCCGGIMHPLEPLYHCSICPKAFHGTCIGERRPKKGEVLKRQWTCPRHTCTVCGKPQAADGAIFMCDACPRSYCFDCLDPRYLEMEADGTRLLHIRTRYADMAAEEMEEKRSCYYITCLRCCGVVASSSSSEQDEGSEGEDSSYGNDGAVVLQEEVADTDSSESSSSSSDADDDDSDDE